MTQPLDPAGTDETQREEARRQAESQGGQTLEVADGMLDVVTSGVIEATGAVAGAALDATVTVAKVSLEVVGSVLGGLTDL